MPDRPVKLTFPRAEPYGYNIMAGGRQVGKIVEGYADWEAYLWCEPGPRFTGYADLPVVRPRLAEVREALRERVAEKGPWWTVLGDKERSEEKAE